MACSTSSASFYRFPLASTTTWLTRSRSRSRNSVGKKLTSWWFEFGGNGENRYFFGPDDHSPEIEENVPYMGSVSGALNRLGC